MLNSVSPVTREQNGNNVKPCVSVMQAVFRELGQRRFGNLALLKRRHRQLRYTV